MIDKRHRGAQDIQNSIMNQIADNAKLCSIPIPFLDGTIVVPDVSKDYKVILRYATEMAEEMVKE
jgi:hypothetical protein